MLYCCRFSDINLVIIPGIWYFLVNIVMTRLKKGALTALVNSVKSESWILKKEILRIGIPAFLETLFTTIAGIIDSTMVSALGVTAISAIGVTNQPRLFFFSVFIAINTVLSSLIAKYNGKKDRDMANRLFDSALKIVILLSILLSLLAVVFARPIMIAFSHQPDTLADSVLYFRIVMSGMIFNSLFTTINASLRGCGMTRMTFVTSVLSSVVNIIFNYFLIEGRAGFPRLGITGAALATVLGNAAALVLCVCWVMKKDLFINIPYCVRAGFRLSREILSEPASLVKSTFTDNFASRLSLLIISAIVARIGSYQMAIYSLGMHLMNVNFALGMGLQTSAVALLGRSFGEEDRGKILSYKRAHMEVGLLSAAVLAVIIIVGGRAYFGLFSDDEEFISTGALTCIIIGIVTLFQTLKFIYTGCLLAVSAMKDVMRASVISFSVVNIGMLLILIFVFRSGIWGVWIASLSAQAAQALMLKRSIDKNKVYSGGEYK